MIATICIAADTHLAAAAADCKYKGMHDAGTDRGQLAEGGGEGEEMKGV